MRTTRKGGASRGHRSLCHDTLTFFSWSRIFNYEFGALLLTFFSLNLMHLTPGGSFLGPCHTVFVSWCSLSTICPILRWLTLFVPHFTIFYKEKLVSTEAVSKSKGTCLPEWWPLLSLGLLFRQVPGSWKLLKMFAILIFLFIYIRPLIFQCHYISRHCEYNKKTGRTQVAC